MLNQLDDKPPAEQLKEMRAILAAIQREATNKGMAEIIDLAQKADQLAESLLKRGAV